MFNSEVKITNYFNQVTNTLKNIDKSKINQFVNLLLETYENENTIFVFGNGGSGATASHFCADLIMGVSYNLNKKFKAICLNDNVPNLSAVANDYSYENIFVGPLKNFLKKGDLVVGISGSGNSLNVIKAIDYANDMGVKTVAFCGYEGGIIKKKTHLSIHVNINDMEVSEDIHLIVSHCVKQILAERIKTI